MKKKLLNKKTKTGYKEKQKVLLSIIDGCLIYIFCILCRKLAEFNKFKLKLFYITHA